MSGVTSSARSVSGTEPENHSTTGSVVPRTALAVRGDDLRPGLLDDVGGVEVLDRADGPGAQPRGQAREAESREGGRVEAVTVDDVDVRVDLVEGEREAGSEGERRRLALSSISR